MHRRLAIAAFTLVVLQPILAEQSVSLAGYEVHYSVIQSAFLQPEVATRYNLLRAPNRAVISIAARHTKNQPPPDKITGVFTNLLSQRIPLSFQLVEEGDARYYIASFLFTSEEMLTFEIQLHQGDEVYEFSFKKQIFAS